MDDKNNIRLMNDFSNKRALDDAETETKGQPKSKNAVMRCSGCGNSDVKYRCPRCERITCSLMCCLAHKKQHDCNGKRDRTKFVDVKKFTDADLSSDFFFLEEVSRSTNSAQRSHRHLNANARRYNSNKKRKVVMGTSINPDIPSDWLARFPTAVQVFAEHAVKRGVALTLLPSGMSKRVRNSSYMNTKANTMFWRVEWAFPSAEVSMSLFEERANEQYTLCALLQKYLNPSMENVATRGKLKKYAVTNWEKNILLLLRREFTPASQPQFYRLDGNQSLESNLKRKAIVEFPVIIVALVTDADKYPMAHDVIETISSTPVSANEPQVHSENQDMGTVTLSDKILSEETQTDAGLSTTINLLSVPDERRDDIVPCKQHKRVLVEEMQVTAH
ncbi:putative Zinc finger, HIT-type [Plasmopara halstedii]